MHVAVHQYADLGHMPTFPLAAGQIVAAARCSDALSDVTFSISTSSLYSAQPDPDVLAFSLYVWNLQRSLHSIAEAQERYPHALIVCGGPSVPREPARAREFLEKHAGIDVLVIGEGELTFRELLTRRLEGKPLRDIAGTVFRSNGQILTGPERSRIRDFSQTASPYLDGTFEKWLEGEQQPIAAALLETNRGCPFRCSFCDWGQATASRVNDIPMDRIKAEVDWLVDRAVPYFYLIDANFGIRKRDPEIIEYIASSREGSQVPQFCYFHLTKNATTRNLTTVETLLGAGIGCHIAISMQSYEPAALKAIQRDNISLEVYEELRQTCAQRGIPTANELLLGLPEQTYDGFVDGLIKTVSPWPGDSFFLYPVRLLENAAMASAESRERFQLDTRWSEVARDPATNIVEREEVVVSTRTLPLASWRRAMLLGSVLNALYNLHLGSVIIGVLHGHGFDLRGWLEGVVDSILNAEASTVFGDFRSDFNSLVDGLLAGGGSLKREGVGLPGGPREAHELLAIRALMNPDQFFAELESCLMDACDGNELTEPQLVELARLQSVVVQGGHVSAHWDWAQWWSEWTDGMAVNLSQRPTSIQSLSGGALHGAEQVLGRVAMIYAKQWRPAFKGTRRSPS